MAAQTIVVFGGTGFLGRRVTNALLKKGFHVRIATRHPERGKRLFPESGERVQSVRADVMDETSLPSVLDGAYGAVNAVSLYVESGNVTFNSVHVDAAGGLAQQASKAGLQRLIQLSGMGADTKSSSSYIRSRGGGEIAVRAKFPDATVVRPSVMFGVDDAFLKPLAKLLKMFPAFPLFGTGATRLQPVFVEDVGEAIAGELNNDAVPVPLYEFGGPDVLTYREILQRILQHANWRRLLLPFPFPMWQAAGFAAEFLPSPPVTRNQVELMEIDNVASGQYPGFAALGISPRSIDDVLPSVLRNL